MAGIRLQFHAEASELVALASAWIARHELHAVVQWITPDFVVKPWPADVEGARRICLARAPFDLSADAPHTFLSRNPESFVIDVGERIPEGLRESELSAAGEDPASMKLWRALVRDAKSRMHHGATVVNPLTGARAPWPRGHHMPGAHELAASGVPMLAVAGQVRYEFDDLTG